MGGEKSVNQRRVFVFFALLPPIFRHQPSSTLSFLVAVFEDEKGGGVDIEHMQIPVNAPFVNKFT